MMKWTEFDKRKAEVEVKDGIDMAEAMSAFVNSFSPDIKSFVEEFTREHRTLQQTFTGLCFLWLKELSKMYENGNYDGRNEASCKLANDIVNTLKDDMYNLPLI